MSPEQIRSLRYNLDGLIPVVTQDHETRDVLMMAWMNAESLRLTFDQGSDNSFYFAEEILSTLSSDREIRVSDRATIFNLMIGLDGYTISTGIISDDLDPAIVAVPLDVDERIEIGWIGHSAIPLTEQARRYLTELRAVVTEGGITLLG